MRHAHVSWLGVWLGAALFACLAARVLIYLLTGELIVPSRSGPRHLSVDQAANELDEWVIGPVRRRHG